MADELSLRDFLSTSPIKGKHSKFHPAKLQVYLDGFSYPFDHRDDLAAAFSRGTGFFTPSKPLVRGEVRCAC